MKLKFQYSAYIWLFCGGTAWDQSHDMFSDVRDHADTRLQLGAYGRDYTGIRSTLGVR